MSNFVTKSEELQIIYEFAKTLLAIISEECEGQGLGREYSHDHSSIMSQETSDV